MRHSGLWGMSVAALLALPWGCEATLSTGDPGSDAVVLDAAIDTTRRDVDRDGTLPDGLVADAGGDAGDGTTNQDAPSTDSAQDTRTNNETTSPVDTTPPSDTQTACTGCQPGAVEDETRPCGPCNGGTQSRSRTCGQQCVWSDWSAWSACTETGCCGDGVVDSTVDAATGWFREECDLAGLNGVGDAPCGTDCRYRRCDDGRACGPLRSTFAAYVPWGEARMREHFLAMKRHGYQEIVIVNIGAQRWTNSGGVWSPTGIDNAFYDASAGSSVLQTYVSTAEKAGIDVIVGLAGIIATGGYDWEVWMNASRRGPFVAHSLDLAAEVVRQVGGSTAFKGFYISNEMNLGDAAQCSAAGDFYAALIAGAQGRQGLRALAGARGVMIAPYLAVGGRTAAQIGANFSCLYAKLQGAGGIDRIMVQDGVPKEAEGFTSLANVGSYFRAMYNTLSGTQKNVLWVDLETYAWPTSPCFLSRPADIDRIGAQVREIGRFVDGFTQWIHAHDFTAAGLGQDTCDPQRQALGDAYVRRPFPFHGFVYRTSVILRGYFLRAGGTAQVQCNTPSGRQTLTYNAGNGLSVHYAPSWVVDNDVPEPTEIYEVTFPVGSCTGGYTVTYIGPDGTASSVLSF